MIKKAYCNEDFSDMNLRGQNFSECNLSHANFHGSDLRSADFRNSICNNAFFYMADMEGCDLRGANLHGAKLNRANLKSVITDDDTAIPLNIKGANIDDEFGKKLLKLALDAIEWSFNTSRELKDAAMNGISPILSKRSDADDLCGSV